jgi:hypothetical protein
MIHITFTPLKTNLIYLNVNTGDVRKNRLNLIQLRLILWILCCF